MIDRSFLEKVEEMAAIEIKTIDDRPYSTKPLHAVKLPTPEMMAIGTLSGIKDYLTANPDGLDLKKVVVHVAGPEKVNVFSAIEGQFAQRHYYLAAVPSLRKFTFGQYYRVEEFVIALQARFVPDETVAQLIKLVGNLTDGVTKNFNDDGVTQQVTAKAGIARVQDVPVPNPVELAPYRTFMEVEQVRSRFVFRIKGGGESPLCALFEADGGAWELEAVERIRDWLECALPKGVTILA